MIKLERVRAAGGRASAVAAAAVVACGVSVVAAPDASAANQVCHNGTTLQPPAVVHIAGGSDRLLYPQTCASDVSGFRPMAGAHITYRRVGDSTLRRCSYNGDQMCATLGFSIDIRSVTIGY